MYSIHMDGKELLNYRYSRFEDAWKVLHKVLVSLSKYGGDVTPLSNGRWKVNNCIYEIKELQ